MNRRVVVTGMGAVTPIGNCVDDYFKSLVNGTHGFDYIKSFDTTDSKVKLGAEIKDLDESLYLKGKQRKRLDKYSRLGMIAAKQAYTDAGLDKLDGLDMDRMGVIVGTGVGGMNTILEEHSNYLDGGSNYVSPLLVPKFIPNILSGNIAIEYGIHGMVSTVITACAASSNAIGDAYRNIKHGYLDVIVAGGSESCINPVMVSGFANMSAINQGDDRDRASIPFDKDRSGFVIGEGAGMLVIEELNHALYRGAHIYGEIVGYGSTCDAYHLTAPSKDGAQISRAIQQALDDANISPSDIGYINAHGTSTPYNDRIETKAIKNIFGDAASKVPISSTKSMIGHLLGGAGAVEAIACLKSLEEGILHPTAGYRVSDSDCDLDYIVDGARKHNADYVMSNSFGFGGHNTVLVFKRY